MHRSTRSLLVIALSMLIGILPTAATTTARTPSQISTPAAQSPAPTDSATPLSRRCGRVTPPGQPEPACCISGIVFIDGSPVAGATVEIQNPHGDATTMITQVYSGTETRPFYAVSLSAAPLNVVENDVITVTAKYSGHEKSISYKVQPGSQQIDIALPRMPDDNYVFARQIRGQAASGRLNEPSRVAADGTGSIYVIDGDNDRIQVFDRNGQFLRQWGTRGTLPGQFDFGGIVSGIAIDPTGNIYVADAGNHRVQKFSSNGNWLLSWGGFGENQGQFNYPSGISIDKSGKVYVADSGNSRIQIFSSTGTWLNAWGTGYPSDVAVDSSGHVYVVDDMDALQYSSNGTLLAILNTPPGAGLDYEPFGITIDRDDNVYVVDARNGQIHKFSGTGVWSGTWGSYGTTDGKMNKPRGAAVDSNGDVFVADTGNDRIQRFDPNGQWLVTWGSVGSTLSRLVNPGQVSVDQNGNVYVIDATNRVQKFSNNGVWLAFIGSSGSGPGQLSSPSSLAFDTSGNIYILDAGNNQIQKFNSNGIYLTTWGASGSSPGQFNAPNDISIDASGNIYVADTGNDRIEKFSTSGTYITAWGSGSTPNGISVDASGNVYVLNGGSSVQKFSPSGAYMTAWEIFNNDPGQDHYANGIAVDLNGDVYVVDAVMAKVQKFTGDGQPLASWGCYGTAIGCFNFGDSGQYVADITVDTAGRYILQIAGIIVSRSSDHLLSRSHLPRSRMLAAPASARMIRWL